MSKGEGGSWFFGIVLIVVGAFLILNGILNAVGWNPMVMLSADPAAARAVGTSAWTDLCIAGFAIVGGIGLIQDQEWGWGISLVILTFTVVKFLGDSIAAITAMVVNPLGAIFSLSVVMYIGILIVGGVGIAYLLLTKFKYE